MITKRFMTGLFVLLMTLSGTVTTASAAEAGNCVVNLASGQTNCYSSAEAAKRSVNAAVAVLIMYEHINFGGDVVIFEANTTCTAAYDNETDKTGRTIPFLNNAISSWQTLDCRVRFWDGPNFGPPMTPLSYAGRNCPDMRTCFGSNWNDRPSSLALT